MVLKYSEDGYPYHEPPYDEAELAILNRVLDSPPIAIYRRRRTPDTGLQPPPPQDSEAKPDQTPKRS